MLAPDGNPILNVIEWDTGEAGVLRCLDRLCEDARFATVGESLEALADTGEALADTGETASDGETADSPATATG